MGIFGQYAKNEGNLYDDLSNRSKRLYFDCEADYILRCIGTKVGKSTSPDHKGRPFFAGEFLVEEIRSKGENSEKSVIGVGSKISFHKWLPRSQDVEDMPLKDKYSLAEAKECIGAIIGLRGDYMDLATADALCEDDGAALKDRMVGVSVTPFVQTKTKKGVDGTDVDVKTTFWNSEWFPVDENNKRIAPKTPEELGI